MLKVISLALLFFIFIYINRIHVSSCELLQWNIEIQISAIFEHIKFEISVVQQSPEQLCILLR